MKLILKVKKHIQDYNLFSYGDSVIVGVSGGGDSVTLISLLYTLQHELGIQLHIAHYNHGLRRQAKADQKFVENLAKQLNIPCTTKTDKTLSKIQKGSIEEKARDHRMRFFLQLAKKLKFNTVALAHTEDDLAETVLIRILRGSGLQGVRSILPKRNIGGYTFVRPLLGVRRKEVEHYLKQNKISFCTDRTNQQKTFFRNKVRLDLLPLLEKGYSRNIKSLLSNMADTATTDYDYLETQAGRTFDQLTKKTRNHQRVQFTLVNFRKQHPALQRLLVRTAIEHIQGHTKRLTLAHARKIEDLVKTLPPNARVDLPNKLSAKKTRDALILYIRKT